MGSSSITGRLLQYVLVLLVAVTINFLLPRLMPGNPLALIAGADVGLLTPEQRQERRSSARKSSNGLGSTDP